MLVHLCQVLISQARAVLKEARHDNDVWARSLLQQALRMTWRGRHPVVKRLEGDYPNGVRLSKKEMKPVEARLERSEKLPKYDITIKARTCETQVN